MEDKAIMPNDVTAINAASPEEIAKVSESIIAATNITNKAADELQHLSNCLADFSETHERYQKNVKHVKGQMSYLSRHL